MFRTVGDLACEGVAYALCWLGYTAVRQGNQIRATALLSESLTLFQQIDHYEGQALCLVGLAALFAAREQPEQAACLCGAADVIAPVLRPWLIGASSLRLIDHAEYDNIVADIRAQLDDATFAAAWAAGQAMSLEQAIAYALSATE